MKGLNLAVTFLLEIVMLVAFALWGFATGSTIAAKLLLGLGIPTLAATFWGLFMAPKAWRRLPDVLYLLVKVVLFALATAALLSAGYAAAGILLAVVFVINTTLLYVFR